MIECQLRPNKITNEQIIEAMMTVRKEYFLQDSLKAQSYFDCELEVASKRFIASNQMIGKMLQVGFNRSMFEQVLLIGEPCGYVAALLARLADIVFVVESDLDLANAVEARFRADPVFDNIKIVQSHFCDGYEAQAPYDAIFITEGAEAIPDNLMMQLSDQGKLVYFKISPDQQTTMIKKANCIASLSVLTKHNDSFSEQLLDDCYARRSVDFCAKESFVF